MSVFTNYFVSFCTSVFQGGGGIRKMAPTVLLLGPVFQLQAVYAYIQSKTVSSLPIKIKSMNLTEKIRSLNHFDPQASFY